MRPNFVIKAFDKDYNEIPYAIEDDDFTMEIPEDCVLKKVTAKKYESIIDEGTHEQSLGEFASDCGDDESVWGYDGDKW